VGPVEGLLAGLHAAAADDAYRPVSEHGPYESMVPWPRKLLDAPP
jgi:hypothetical protein